MLSYLSSLLLAAVTVLPLSLPLLAATNGSPTGSITVAAAASTRDVLTDIAASFKNATGINVNFTFHASSFLARQVAAGAPIDLILSADLPIIERLAANNHVVASSITNVAMNELVLITPIGEKWQWISGPTDLSDSRIERIALCDIAVPIGFYGRALLKTLWDDDSGSVALKIVKPDHARAALAMVETGLVGAGFVYLTDAISRPERVRIAYRNRVPGGKKIIYPAAILTRSEKKPIAEKFINHLHANSDARMIWRRHGFLPAE